MSHELIALKTPNCNKNTQIQSDPRSLLLSSLKFYCRALTISYDKYILFTHGYHPKEKQIDIDNGHSNYKDVLCGEISLNIQFLYVTCFFLCSG